MGLFDILLHGQDIMLYQGVGKVFHEAPRAVLSQIRDRHYVAMIGTFTHSSSGSSGLLAIVHRQPIIACHALSISCCSAAVGMSSTSGMGIFS